MHRRALQFKVQGQRNAEYYMGGVGYGLKCEGWCEKGGCTLPIKVECRR